MHKRTTLRFPLAADCKMKTLTALFFVTAVGCAVTPTHTDQFCALASPILVDLKNDKLTDATKHEILKYNELGALLCGWKPTK